MTEVPDLKSGALTVMRWWHKRPLRGLNSRLMIDNHMFYHYTKRAMDVPGIEPGSTRSKRVVFTIGLYIHNRELPISYFLGIIIAVFSVLSLMQTMGIEPMSIRWKRTILPLNYVCLLRWMELNHLFRSMSPVP